MSLVQPEDLTDDQWAMLESIVPEPRRRDDGRGRPWRDRREVLNGILYVLRTGSRWADLPAQYPPYQTCHRRFLQWVRSGVMGTVLQALDAHPVVHLRCRLQGDITRLLEEQPVFSDDRSFPQNGDGSEGR